MFEILTVCTGNICRSPLAAQLLSTRLRPFDVLAASAGTRGLQAAPMTAEAQRLAVALGIDEQDAAAHRSRYLTEAMLQSPDLILAMTREHRHRVAELAPAGLRRTFTVRELARLLENVPDDDLRRAADEAGPDAGARVRSVATVAAAQRGIVAPPDPADDDVIDPYGRSWETYQLSASQLVPAVDVVARALRVALA